MKLPTDSQLPTELTRKVDSNLDYNPLHRAFIARQTVKPNDVYPVNLAFKKVHKMILATESTKTLPGPNGDKNQYLGAIAFGLHVEYTNRVITTRLERGFEQYIKGNELKINTFTAIFPLRTWDNMFMKAVGQSYSEYYPNPIEVHFIKRTLKDYELKFLAIVEWNKDKNKFDRKIIEYRDLKYKEK